MEAKILKELEKGNYLSVAKLIETNTALKKEGSQFRIGRVLINREGPAYLRMPGEPGDIKVEHKNLNGAIYNDIALIKLLKKGNQGQVVNIINREINQYVGEYYLKDNIGFIKLDNPKYNITIKIPLELSKGAVEGNKVVVKISDKSGKFSSGEIIRILGHVNDVEDIEILSSIYGHGFNIDFPEEVMNEVEKAPFIVSEEEIKGRRDFRSQNTFTIDGDDAKDHDDAVALEMLPNDNFKLYVHIADVTHYVKEGTFLYNEAYDRGTSVYLVDRVVPMLPHKLSNGICSLNENVDRLTLTCEMEIDKSGNVIKYDIYESVINSKKRMTYNDVNQLLEKDIVVDGYEEFVGDLKNMSELASILRKSKEARGYLDFDTDEIKIIVDDKGQPTEVKKRDRGIGENLIEDFMIIANEVVATHVFNQNLPFVYRVHARPRDTRIKEYLEFIAKLGIKVSTVERNFNPKTVQKILEDLRGEEYFGILSSHLLRKLSKAEYQPDNIGHFGLASTCYTHFTSPIRRFPDLKVHQLLKKYNKLMDKETASREEEILPALCAHSSSKEYYAVMCERDVNAYESALYMKQHIGKTFEGIISDMTKYGLFIILDNLIEGRAGIFDLPGKNYWYNEAKMQFEGRGPIYRIGQKVKIEVIRACEKEREIDFKILKSRGVNE